LAYLNRLIQVETSDPEDFRQRQLLNVLLIGVGTAALIGIFITLIFAILGEDPGGAFGPIYFGGTIVILGVVVLLFINRYWSGTVAGSLFVVLISLSLVFGDEPMEVVEGRTLFMFAVPILISSGILRPWASFVTAALISVLLNIIAFLDPNLVAPVIIAPLGLFIIALLASMGTRNLKNALRDLRIANEQLIEQSAALQDSNTLLRQEIAERGRIEESLREQSQALARTNAELQQFAYISTHDLREPMRKVRVYAELLEQRYQGQLDDKADKYLQYVVSGATRIQALITDLLAYLEAGNSSDNLSFQATDLNQVLDHVLNDLELLVKENAAVITHDPLPVIQADPVQMNHLLQNLLTNAIKFRRDEPPAVHISAGGQDGQWLFSVTDNGVGIEAQYLERIFVIFQRLQSQEVTPGTGIGLAICKKIVENHNGRIWAESTPGQGSTFYFTLPV
jgi:signal transduction histidine kinase